MARTMLLAREDISPAIEKLQRRLRNVEEIDPNNLDDFEDTAKSLVTLTNATLVDVFGADSAQFRRAQVRTADFVVLKTLPRIPRHERAAAFAKGQRYLASRLRDEINILKEAFEDSQRTMPGTGNVEPSLTVDQKSALAKTAKDTAVILTALGTETEAVLRRLGDVRDENVEGTVFHRGVFGEWDIAVVEVGPGNRRAAAIGTRALDHFKPQVALFVGVAGGAKDVNIGDIVVATKVYGYESGKEEKHGFKPRPDVGESAHEIESLVRAMRQRQDWRARLKEPGRDTNASDPCWSDSRGREGDRLTAKQNRSVPTCRIR